MVEEKIPVNATIGIESTSTPQNSTAKFSKVDTNVVKGLAVCLLLIHHLYVGVLPAPISLFGNPPVLIFATLSKVCVAVFTLLSGYGLAKSYEKSGGSSIRFAGRHLAGLMKQFWLIYIIFFIGGVFLAYPDFTPAAVYGRGFRGALNAVIEFFALRPLFGTGTINQTWWYMETALVLYILFPILYKFTKKFPWLSLPLTSIPLILYYILGNNVWNTCREIYWFFPFVVGIFLANRDLLNKFCRVLEKKRLCVTLISFGALFIIAVCRAKIGLAFDTFFACAIVFFVRASFCQIPYLRGAFAYTGKHSSDVFMVHSFFYCYFISQKLFGKLLYSPNPIMQFSALPALLILSLVCSEGLDVLRKILKKLP